MSTLHVIIYVPGLGDRNLSGRKKLLSLWHYRNTIIEVCPMHWTTPEPWQVKLDRLLIRIDELYAQDKTVSLIGESAGATAVIQAIAQKADKLNAVVLLCGKSQFPDRVAAERYRQNPAFKDALINSSNTIPKLTPKQKKLLLNLHPLFDPVVPVQETKIAGVKDSYMLSIGHAASIVFANTLWSFRIVRFIRKLK